MKKGQSKRGREKDVEIRKNIGDVE